MHTTSLRDSIPDGVEAISMRRLLRPPPSKQWRAPRNDVEPIKAVIFDVGNVLIHFDAVRSAKQFSKRAGVPFEKVWSHFFTSRVEKAYTRGEITTREFYRHAKRAFNSTVDFTTFSKLWNDIFWENREIRPILKKLSRCYPLYLISNTNALHFNHVRQQFPQIFRHFKRTFPSHVVGHRKPDRRIFWKVLKPVQTPLL